MVYAGSKDALTRALVGVSTKISATDLSELTEAIVVEACKKFAWGDFLYLFLDLKKIDD